jgi:putative membrane protein
MSEPARRRWPSSVYGSGAEPDPRFTLANERTLLAWIRTALALVGAGVVIDAVDLEVSDTVQRVLGGILVVLGGLAAVGAWFRWASIERAMRNGKPLPGLPLAAGVIFGLVVVGVVVLVALAA